ncbi:hypothetical protein ACOMHN_003193 [Nucella lapillus]
MEPKCVHHVEFGVLNGLKHVRNFLSRYKFRLAGTRITPCSKQWLVTSHAVRFLITELSRNGTVVANDPYVHSWTFPTETDIQPVRDSVFNVALRVNNIEGFVNRLSKQNVIFIKPLQSVSDHVGSVRVCMVKSCLGNVVHTLIEDTDYGGFFLPGFQAAEQHSENFVGNVGNANLTGSEQPPSVIDLHDVDHVTFCLPRGSSASTIDWYENCFGMKRFFINREDDEDEGFVISSKDMGMRLKAFEYWKCAETGLATEEKAKGSVKFVLAETLPDQGPNQLDMFLTNHGGAGVQHVGLHTGDIIGTISQLQTNGVKFNEAPYTYYTKVGRLKEMITIGVNVDLIRKNRILVDLEDEEDGQGQSGTAEDSPSCNGTEADTSLGPGSVRYLMQKFTQPLFEADTFYLEVIQRVGATGFGSGNITALWRSLQAYFKEKEVQCSQSQDGCDKV